HVIAHVLRHVAGNVDATKTAKASLGLITERDLAGHIEQTTDVRLSEGRRGHDRHQRNSGQDDRELPHHSCTPQFVLWILVCLWFHTPSPGVPAESFPVSFPRTVPGLRVGRFPAPVASVKLSPSHLLSHCATARKRDWKHFTLPVGGLYSPTWSGFLLSAKNFFVGNTANHAPPLRQVSPRSSSCLPFRLCLLTGEPWTYSKLSACTGSSRDAFMAG